MPSYSSDFPLPPRPGLVTRLMRLFFRLLYHPLAWTYDLVAAVVSLGRWKRWVLEAEALLPGQCILELGFGPGHLQAKLQASGRQVYGLDESAQMARQSYRRLTNRRANKAPSPRLARGLAQALPYPAAAFDSVVATFPTPYIIHPTTLAEVLRVLRPGGRLVVLSAAWHTGRSLQERLMAFIFRITRQAPQQKEIDENAFARPFEQAGFVSQVKWIETPGSRLLFIIAARPNE